MTEQNPNAEWAHAKSLEPQAEYYGLKAELQYMKDLFYYYLPTVGNNMSKIDDHFAQLEQALEEGRPIVREQFEDNDEDNDDKGGNKPDYQYISASLFKERASRFIHGTDGLRVADSTDNASTECATQSDSAVSSPRSLVSECEETC